MIRPIRSVTRLKFNAFKGHPVFILAPGLSLRDEDLTPLKDYYTFGVGRVIDWDGLPFVPSLYEMNEEKHPSWDKLNKLGMVGFTRPQQQYINPKKWLDVGFPKLGRTISEETVSGLTKESLYENVPTLPGFSGVSMGVQPCIWLGFDPIYLVGMEFGEDYVYGGQIQPRFTKADATMDWQRLLEALPVIRHTLESDGRSIVNLTKGSRENILPTGDLKEVLRSLAK